MPKPAPFSVTSDAADYVRHRLNTFPPGEEPVIIMDLDVGEALDESGEKVRWWYEGENFIIGYFEPDEKPQTEQIELLGRSVSITLEALKRLAGQTLALRRVDAPTGFMKNIKYVLIPISGHETEDDDRNKKSKRILTIGAFIILGGFSFGVGITWILFATLAPIFANVFHIQGDKFLNKFLPWLYPLFATGGILGVIGTYLYFRSRSIFKTKGRTKFAQEQIERKYFGYGGLTGDWGMPIFWGMPVPLIAILVLTLEPFAHSVGAKTAVAVGIIMLVFAITMIISERIPRRLVLRLGLLGWALTIISGYWYFKTYGP